MNWLKVILFLFNSVICSSGLTDNDFLSLPQFFLVWHLDHWVAATGLESGFCTMQLWLSMEHNEGVSNNASPHSEAAWSTIRGSVAMLHLIVRLHGAPWRVSSDTSPHSEDCFGFQLGLAVRLGLLETSSSSSSRRPYHYWVWDQTCFVLSRYIIACLI